MDHARRLVPQRGKACGNGVLVLHLSKRHQRRPANDRWPFRACVEYGLANGRPSRLTEAKERCGFALASKIRQRGGIDRVWIGSGLECCFLGRLPDIGVRIEQQCPPFDVGIVGNHAMDGFRSN